MLEQGNDLKLIHELYMMIIFQGFGYRGLMILSEAKYLHNLQILSLTLFQRSLLYQRVMSTDYIKLTTQGCI
jgi:hypothetical protein